MSEKDQKASVGRIVHFIYHGKYLAAMIVHIYENGSVNLFVPDDGEGTCPHRTITSATQGSEDYCWKWPEKV